MRKFLFLVVISATFIIVDGCSKKESNETVDAQAVEETNPSKTDVVYKLSSACCYWRHTWEGKETCQNEYCYEAFCYLTVGCIGEVPMEIEVAVDTNQHKVKSLSIHNYVSIPAGYGSYFQDCINNGYIDIHYDCPIDDPSVLNMVPSGYIPAGHYIVTSQGGNAVILFE